MKKTITLFALIFIFFQLAEVKAESYYLYCHNKTFSGDEAYSHIDITYFQNNGIILLRFNKYGPSISQGVARFIYYEHTPAFGIFSYPYLYIFSSHLLYCKPGTTECLYHATILTLEYGSWQFGLFIEDGFILRDTWEASLSELGIAFGMSSPNTWTHHVPSNSLVYRFGYQGEP